jgi:hypothetical protein
MWHVNCRASLNEEGGIRSRGKDGRFAKEVGAKTGADSFNNKDGGGKHRQSFYMSQTRFSELDI